MEIGALIEALSRPEAYSHAVESVEVHQTHISVVFLAGPFAYKIKKPVNLGFLDFSTLEKRKYFCEEEVRLNRRLAAEVYLGVVPITSEPERHRGACISLRTSPSADIVEWAVQMKRLPARATLEQHLLNGEVTEDQIRSVAQRIAAFHQQAESGPRISDFGKFDVVAQNARENFVQAEPLVGAAVSPTVFERVKALTETHLVCHQALIEKRAAESRPRDTHGDLHLDHVYFFPEATPPNDLLMIDCIEFNDRFRYADPVADMAFLAMDLAFHGRRDLARVFSETYFQASGDAEGRQLLPFYTAYRAVVRAKVEGMELGEVEIELAEREAAAARARAHWLLALGELEVPEQRPALLLIAGLPGSGKSTLARALAASANLEVLRSDVVRKELAAGAPGDLYTQDWTDRTYTELLVRTEELFWQGRRVAIDANFRDDAWRRRFLAASRRWAVPAFFIHCHADEKVVKKRLAARRHDASDADWSVFQMLRSDEQPLSDEVRRAAFLLDTSGEVVQSLASIRGFLAKRGLIS